MRKAAYKKREEEDPIDQLISWNKTLARRDAEAKLLKIRRKRALFNRVFKCDEVSEDHEEYSEWFSPDLEHCFFAMYSRHRTCYRKGD